MNPGVNIFFDLDHTLWDFESNSRETIQELLEKYFFDVGIKIDFEDFFGHFKYIHKELWRLYQNDTISSTDIRYRRFRYAFGEMGVKEGKWIDDFGKDYIDVCPTKGKLVEGALDLLNYLKSKYSLHIITNGFQKTQQIKLEKASIADFFRTLTTSESTGAKKPSREIFTFALNAAGCLPEDAWYIGDDYAVDIEGACRAGLNAIFFNPEGESNPLGVPEVKRLNELKRFL